MPETLFSGHCNAMSLRKYLKHRKFPACLVFISITTVAAVSGMVITAVTSIVLYFIWILITGAFKRVSAHVSR